MKFLRTVENTNIINQTNLLNDTLFYFLKKLVNKERLEVGKSKRLSES